MKGETTMKKYTITLTEEQMSLIADAVEDWCRFLCGQCELDHATGMLLPTEYIHEVRDMLTDNVRRYIVPDLPHGASYGWNGGHCPNDYQRKAIAMSYGIYRQILHTFAVEHDWHNTYSSPTLTCPEQGGLIQIKAIEEQRKEE